MSLRWNGPSTCCLEECLERGKFWEIVGCGAVGSGGGGGSEDRGEDGGDGDDDLSAHGYTSCRLFDFLSKFIVSFYTLVKPVLKASLIYSLHSVEVF